MAKIVITISEEILSYYLREQSVVLDEKARKQLETDIERDVKAELPRILQERVKNAKVMIAIAGKRGKENGKGTG